MPRVSRKSPQRISLLNNGRVIIGLFIEGLDDQYQAGVWSGIEQAVRKRDVNLVCFAGGALGKSPQNPWEYQRNILYRIGWNCGPDCLIVAGSLGNFVPDERYHSFLERTRRFPTVTLGPTALDIPSILVDNGHGMRALVTHLIEDHESRRFAFIRGPEGNAEAEERFRLFGEVLSAHGISIDPDMLFAGDFTRECGEQVVSRIADRIDDLDAIVAVNDDTALGALQALTERGIKVPDEIALTGFDDFEESEYITPPLTTVRQPLCDLGGVAVDTVLRLLDEGRDAVPCETVLEAGLIVRRSCGCFAQEATVAISEKSRPETVGTGTSLDETEVEEEVIGLLAEHGESAHSFVHDVVSCFCGDLSQGRLSGRFDRAVDRAAGDALLRGMGLRPWFRVLDALWNHAVVHPGRGGLSLAGVLLRDARSVLSTHEKHEEGRWRIETGREDALLREIGDILSNILDVEQLVEAVGHQLPRVGVKTCFVSLFESTAAPLQGSRMILAFREGKRCGCEVEGRVFPTCRLLPDSVKPLRGGRTVVVQPLYFQSERLGVALFESGVRRPMVYEVLRGFISGSLHSALLVKKVKEQSAALAKANTELEGLCAKEHAYLEAVKSELELGRNIQLGFLPEQLPQPDGWEAAAAFMPAREVSGDFYDAFMLEDRVAMLIGDVSGKDVSAALFMSLVRTLIRAFSERAAAEGEDPLIAVGLVNDYIHQHHRRRGDRCMFATLLFGLLEPCTGSFTYVNAGHCPAFVLGDGIEQTLAPTAGAVGLAADMVFEQQTVSIGHGDILFAYTDGVVEAQNPAGEFFTKERLHGLLEESALSAQALIDAVMSAVQSHTKDALPFDDVAMLAVRRRE